MATPAGPLCDTAQGKKLRGQKTAWAKNCVGKKLRGVELRAKSRQSAAVGLQGVRMRRLRWLYPLMAGLALAGCVAAPSSILVSLDARDRKFASLDCRQARAAVAAYEDRAGERLAARLATRAVGYVVPSVALLPVRAGLSAHDLEQRLALNRALVRGCITNPSPDLAVYLN
jgi:hypothetical protein